MKRLRFWLIRMLGGRPPLDDLSFRLYSDSGDTKPTFTSSANVRWHE